jgi:hypothetical protein
MSDNVVETEITRQELNETTNEQSKSLSNELHETNPYIEDNNKQKGPKEILTKQWSSLFPKLRRGQSTYSSFRPRSQIRSKNENALMIDVQGLHSSFNEIMASLFNNLKEDIIAAKQHFTKGTCTHIEIVFEDRNKLKHHALKGINIFGRTYFGFIPTDARKSFLPVKIRNVPLGNKEAISDAIREAFGVVRRIASIKPLLIERTPYLTDQ